MDGQGERWGVTRSVFLCILLVFSSFDQALDKKRSIMQSEGKNIQAILVREEKDLGVRVNEFNTEWQQKRPTQPDLDHHVVSTTLSTFKTRLDDLQTDLSQLAMAKEVMKMDVKEDKRLDEVDSELKELDEVWNELGKAWNALDDVKRTQFSNLKVRPRGGVAWGWAWVWYMPPDSSTNNCFCLFCSPSSCGAS